MRLNDIDNIINEIIVKLFHISEIHAGFNDVPIEMHGCVTELIIDDSQQYWWFKNWLDSSKCPHDYIELNNIFNRDNGEPTYIKIPHEVIHHSLSRKVAGGEKGMFISYNIFNIQVKTI